MAAPADLDRLEALIGKRHVSVGGDYLRALRKLGLEPDVLAWAREQDTGRVILVLVTAFFDHGGPLEVSQALFRAYNIAATPQDIDPFIVRLHSPRQSFGRELIKGLRARIEVVTNMRPLTDIRDMPGTAFLLGDLEVPLVAVLKWPQQVSTTTEVGRKWERFLRNVDRLAA